MDDPLKKLKENGFYSTPQFIESLTNLSHKLSFLNATSGQKKVTLMRDLVLINEKLPASCYIPFVD